MSEELGKLEEERDQLRRELRGVQEMLAVVLREIGEPVVVPKEGLANGIGNVQIRIDDNIEENAFVFSVEELVE